MQNSDQEARPNHLPWPPMLYVAAVVAALVADRIWPLGLGLAWPWRGIGIAILGAGIALDLSAIFTLMSLLFVFILLLLIGRAARSRDGKASS